MYYIKRGDQFLYQRTEPGVKGIGWSATYDSSTVKPYRTLADARKALANLAKQLPQYGGAKVVARNLDTLKLEEVALED